MKKIYVLTVVLSMLLCATVLYTGCGSNATGGGGSSGGGAVVGGNGTVEVHGILYVTEYNFGEIFIYDDTTGESGLHTPDRVVAGSNTSLDASDLGLFAFIDTAKNKLYVSSADKIVVFANAPAQWTGMLPLRAL